MINRTKPTIKLNAAQKALFDRLTTAQQLRLIQVLEMKQKIGCKRVIKATGANKAARAKQLSQLHSGQLG